MPPSGIPAPLPPWARALLQLTPLISTALQEALQYIGTMQDATGPNQNSWRRFHLIGQPVGSTDRADDFVTTMDIANITGGVIDNSWNDADYAIVGGALDTLMNAWAARMDSGNQWREIRAYRMSFAPYTSTKPFVPTGPPERIFANSASGAGTNYQAPQVAFTSTDISAYPRHWGRNYWPHPRAGLVNFQNRVLTNEVDSWAAAVQTCYHTLMTNQFFPVVVTTQVDKVPTRGLLTVSKVQVDDTLDVIRRRRSSRTTYRKVLAA